MEIIASLLGWVFVVAITFMVVYFAYHVWTSFRDTATYTYDSKDGIEYVRASDDPDYTDPDYE